MELRVTREMKLLHFVTSTIDLVAEKALSSYSHTTDRLSRDVPAGNSISDLYYMREEEITLFFMFSH